MSSQENYKFWVNKIDLLEKPRITRSCFFGERIAVIWRAVFDDISDIHIFALHMDCGEHLI